MYNTISLTLAWILLNMTPDQCLVDLASSALRIVPHSNQYSVNLLTGDLIMNVNMARC